MPRRDLYALIALWVLAVLLAIATVAVMRLPGTTSTWMTSPATNIAHHVRANWALTLTLLLPFLYGPILTLVYALWRFRAGKSTAPARFSKSVKLEVLWTTLPAITIIAIALPAYGLLKKIDDAPNPDLMIDVVGQQFFWQYSYPKYDITVVDDLTGADQMVLPLGSVVQLNGTSPQVNHAWWVPAFGVKFDVLPGRVSTAWFRAEQTGSFQGQCAELCGALHANMLIHVRVVSPEEFVEWLRERGAELDDEDLRVFSEEAPA